MSSASSAAATGTIPAAALTGDVAVAAPGSTVDGFGYVGVWAKDAATCATIGAPDASGFAVITTTSYRDGPTATTGTFGPLSAGNVSLDVGGLTVSLMQISPTSLSINGVAMIRCTP
jgi:hypothetical protein